MANKGLGKGFGSLLPSDFDKSILLDKKDRIQKISLNEIEADKNQPRVHFDQVKLSELAESIKNYGILQPLVVRPDGDKFVIIAGERRFRAAAIAGLSSVPVLVRSSEELERLEIGLVENVQRVDLSPLEQAVSVAKLNEQFNLSIEEIAKRLGKASSTIINIVRLLKLPDEAKQELINQKISEGHARSILALSAKPDQQKKLLSLIIKNSWSVRRAEQYASQNKHQSTKISQHEYKKTEIPKTISIAKKLGAKIVIKPKAKGGDLIISYQNQKTLNEIIKKLS